MRLTVCLLAGLLLASPVAAEGKKAPSALGFTMKSIDGKEVNLADKYKGKVVLLVNVASYCGNTKQYKDLQALHEKYADKGLAIVGVPANEFGKQEPGSDKEILDFCTTKYNVKFDMMSKVVVKGPGICPLYQFLTSKETNPTFGGEIKWNFAKFLIGKNGQVVGRFDPGLSPAKDVVVKAIETELAK